MKLLIFLFSIISVTALAQDPVGEFTDHRDIGHPKKAGSTLADKSNKSYALRGSGYNIWFNRDEFQYAYKKITGDFTVTGDFEFIGTGSNAHRKVGWMIRASADSDAVHYSAVLHGDGLTVLQWRTAKGAAMRDPQDEIFAKDKNYKTLQLQRTGNKIMMRAAKAGGPLTLIGETESNLPEDVLVGLFICSHDENVLEAAMVRDVKID